MLIVNFRFAILIGIDGWSCDESTIEEVGQFGLFILLGLFGGLHVIIGDSLVIKLIPILYEIYRNSGNFALYPTPSI